MTPPPKAAPSLRSLRAAGYVRVSTPDQPLDGQEAELVAYCRARERKIGSGFGVWCDLETRHPMR